MRRTTSTKTSAPVEPPKTAGSPASRPGGWASMKSRASPSWSSRASSHSAWARSVGHIWSCRRYPRATSAAPA